MKRIHWVVVCLTLLACNDDGDETTAIDPSTAEPPIFENNTLLSVQPIDGASCAAAGLVSPGLVVYTDQSAFDAAFASARAGSLPSPVDFSRYVVVGYHHGRASGCSTRVEIVSALNQVDRVDVTVRTTRPEGACPADNSDSYPFAFARVDRLEKPYRALVLFEWGACQPSGGPRLDGPMGGL